MQNRRNISSIRNASLLLLIPKARSNVRGNSLSSNLAEHGLFAGMSVSTLSMPEPASIMNKELVCVFVFPLFHSFFFFNEKSNAIRMEETSLAHVETCGDPLSMFDLQRMSTRLDF